MAPPRTPSRTRWLRIGMGVVAVVAGLGAAGVFWLDQSLRNDANTVLPALSQETQDSVGFFCEQQVILGQDPWFQEPRPEGDAGPLLNAWLPSDSMAEAPAGSPLSMRYGLWVSLNLLDDWRTAPAEASNLDFSWMKQLHAYDRWDVLKGTPVEFTEPLDLFHARLPDFGRVLLWGRLRLLNGVRTGQPLDAARDVRQLAWLLYRTDLLQGAVLAAVLLESEREAHALMQEPPSEWKPILPEQLLRMRAIQGSSSVFSSIATPVETAKQSRRCGVSGVRCPAMTQAALMARFLRPLALEPYLDAYTALEEDLAALPCPTSLGKRVWERGLTFDDPAARTLFSQHEWERRLPRDHFGPLIADSLLARTSFSLYLLQDFRRQVTREEFDFKP